MMENHPMKLSIANDIISQDHNYFKEILLNQIYIIINEIFIF
jgi:hypothetical protein